MRKLFFIPFIIFLFSLQSCIVSKTPNISFFDNPTYRNNGTEYVSVNVPLWMVKPFIKKALKEDEEGEAIMPLIKKLKNVKVLVVSNGTPNMLSNFQNYLHRNNFEEWITVKKETETVNFQAKRNGENFKNLLISVSSKGELVYIDIKGNFNENDISNIINFSKENELKNLAKNK